jgi:hypothetical protein
MLDAAERRDRLADRGHIDPEEQPDGDGGEGVRDVVGARDRQLGERQDATVVPRESVGNCSSDSS